MWRPALPRWAKDILNSILKSREWVIVYRSQAVSLRGRWSKIGSGGRPGGYDRKGNAMHPRLRILWLQHPVCQSPVLSVVEVWIELLEFSRRYWLQSRFHGKWGLEVGSKRIFEKLEYLSQLPARWSVYALISLALAYTSSGSASQADRLPLYEHMFLTDERVSL